MNTMSDYEQSQYNEIIKWKEKEPSVQKRTTSFIMKPVVWVTNKIIPQKAIQTALLGANAIAKKFADEKDIKRDAKVENIAELKTKDLQVSDKLANNVHNWALAIASTEGGICGAIGLPGMVADIPAIITFSLRTIHKIGLCYGYKSTTQEEIQFVYSIMSAAGANTMQEKNIALLTLKQLNVILTKQTWKKMAEKMAQNKMSNEAFLITVKGLAKQLGINITKNGAKKAIPIIGAGVGLAMNAAFIQDISWAARRCFQERWLYDNGKIQTQNGCN